MKDIQGTAAGDEIKYEPRSPEEIAAIEQQVHAPVRGQYVAQPAPGWNVEGLWHNFGAGGRTGYSSHAMALHWMLGELGITTQLVPHRHATIDIETFPSDRYDRLFGWLSAHVGMPKALIVSYPPDIAAEMEDVAPRLIPYSAFEATRVSPFVADLCKGSVFSVIWVVSEFTKSALVASGVSPERIRVVRPVLWGGPWPALTQKRASGPEVSFGTFGTWQKRKGMHDLVRAYWGEFKRDENVVLNIRTSPFGAGTKTLKDFEEKVGKELAEIAKEFGDDDFPASKRQARIVLHTGTSLTDAEVLEWIDSLDVFVNPSYGEGLGIPQVWAKSLGLPMVSTGFGAVGDLLREFPSSVDRVVPHRLEPVGPEVVSHNVAFDAVLSEWGRYDPRDFGKAMREAFGRAAGRHRIGVLPAGQAAAVREAFSWNACRGPLVAALGDAIPEWAGRWP
jgi:glycosyltransferase involved in cell wall biosynthesis